MLLPRNVRRDALLAAALLLAVGCAGGPRVHRSYRIYPDPLRQTIAFERDDLPGQVFKIVIPEIITDREATLLDWKQDVPAWDIGPDRAAWACEIAGVMRMSAAVRFGAEVIEAEVEMTNLSARTWTLANAFTCFAFYAAPLFDNPELDRMRFPVDGRWRTVADLFAETSPGKGPYTFFRVEGGPRLEDMDVCRRVKQRHPKVADYGAGCVVSRDGRWVAGVSADRPAYVFCNRKERCLHANPVYGPIAPGQTARASTFIVILRGGVPDFEKAARGRAPTAHLRSDKRECNLRAGETIEKFSGSEGGQLQGVVGADDASLQLPPDRP